jgi:L-alanine-DL-glutamate epimerase-like enolase superfamily enzyme
MDAASIRSVTARAYRIPTDAPEADGTIEWDATTLVVVEVDAGDRVGLGYSYASAAAVQVVIDVLAGQVVGRSPFDIPALWTAMLRAVRNIGRDGIAISAISAVDVALWDLKARLLDIPLADLFGRARPSVPIYGSGGFTSYSVERLTAQLAGWVEEAGCRWVKMKIGADPAADYDRVRAASGAIGAAELMVDANGAYTRQQALKFAFQFADLGATWFEEPVSSDDLDGLHSLRENGPPGLEIAAGEYAYNAYESRALLQRQAVDVLQIDATRCGGYTGFLRAAALAEAWNLPVSAHTAPALHLPVCCAASHCRHIEWFHDHARIEAMLFDGAPVPHDGTIALQAGAAGHGLAFRRDEAERFALS